MLRGYLSGKWACNMFHLGSALLASVDVDVIHANRSDEGFMILSTVCTVKKRLASMLMHAKIFGMSWCGSESMEILAQ